MASSRPLLPKAEPDAGHLESLDDLLKKKQSEERISSSSSHQNNEGDDSTDTVKITSDDLTSSSLTITPQSPARSTRLPRDESRWNGFHLWRTESYNLRAARERIAAEARNLRERQGWVTSIRKGFKHWYKNAVYMLSGRTEDELEEERAKEDEGMSHTKMFLLTIVLAGAQVCF